MHPCMCDLLLLLLLLLRAGEFRQEQLLLGSSYQVHECRAALQHLRSSSIFGAALSSVLSSLLGIRCAGGGGDWTAWHVQDSMAVQTSNRGPNSCAAHTHVCIQA